MANESLPPEANPVPNVGKPTPWPTSVQLFLLVMLALGLLGLVGKSLYDWGYAAGFAAAQPEADGAFASLDLNRITFAELRTLPGLGDTLARRVIDDRDRKGPFANFADLRRVAGIGPKTLDRLRPFLHVQGSVDLMPRAANVAWNHEAPSIATPRSEARISNYPASRSNGTSSGAPVPLNSASANELQGLPGIGAILAQRIVEDRTVRGKYKSIEELRRVPGIGAKTLEKLRPHAVLDVSESR